MMRRRQMLQVGASAWLAASGYVAAQSRLQASAVNDFFRAVMRNQSRDITTLMLRGFNPNTPDERGRTGLTLAIRQDSHHVVEALLMAPQTDVNLANAQGETPLMLAAIQGNLALVQQLIARGADINREGWAPLHYAASAGLEHSVAIATLFLEKSAYIDAESPNGTTPLMMAAQYSSEAMVKLLLQEGADAQLRNQQGLRAVDFARKSEREFMVELLNQAVRSQRPAATRGKW